MPRLGSRELAVSLQDVSRGILGGFSERGVARPNWMAGADNVYGRPYRAMRVKPGSRDVSTATLSTAPHSLMAHYSSGGNKLFVAAGSSIFEVQGAAYPSQALPASHLANSDILTHANLDGILIATQRGGSLTPLMYDGAWKELKLPVAATTITFGANSAGGLVDVGTHYYRVRHRYAKGSSRATVGFVAPVVGAAVQTVNITAGLNPASPRSDYLGWTLERTKVNGTVDGPWWFVKDSDTATYADAKSDASLGYMADDGLHGEPPHLDGLTAFAGLLWGWSGSNLYASRNIGDIEATGIANFDADDLLQISKDDGDSIQVCLVVLNELLILKKRSVHVISGVDRESFVLESVVYADPSRGSEAGCGGPRAACVIGGKAYFWGESGGMFVYSRGGVSPFGWAETGRYLEDLNSSALDSLLLINHQGNYLVAWYPRGTSSIASDKLIYDARFKQWWHWNGWSARDAIELKGGLFSNATMIYCDPKPDGGGLFHCWVAFDGFKDGRASNGSGGGDPTVVMEYPWIDFGLPDEWKDLDRVAVATDGDQPDISVAITVDPPGPDTAISLSKKTGSGKDWAADAGSNPNDLEWDVGDWAADSPTASTSGVPLGTSGKRFKFTLTTKPNGDYKPTGLDLVATLMPDKEYDR